MSLRWGDRHDGGRAVGVLHLQSAAGEGTDTDGPTDILMRRIVDAFGEYERLIIKARTKAALRSRRAGESDAAAYPTVSSWHPMV